MKSSFSLAALSGIAMAGPHGGRSGHMGGLGGNKLNADPAFLQYAAEYNKDIRVPSTFQSKLNRFHIAQNIIDEQNAKADALGGDTLRLAHNFTSDMEPDEYLAMLGLDTDEANKKKTSLPATSNNNNNRRRNRNRRNRRNGGRGLESDRATVVDHFADGYMSGVKDQGSCGSCWVFAANSTLEGTYALKNNLQNNAPHFSEQQVVDCTLTGNTRNKEMFDKDYDGYGCEGGWMTWAWTFQNEQGIMMEDDYPYTSGTTMTESDCAHDADKTVGEA